MSQKMNKYGMSIVHLCATVFAFAKSKQLLKDTGK
jgi:hypothetical protein